MTAKTPVHTLIPADRVNGTDVISKSGEKLGKIEDVAIEKVSGKVAYAILSFGGMLGIGTHYHPVPWKLLHYDLDKRAYIVPMEKEQLEKAPMINANELSGWTDELTREEIFRYYGTYGLTPFLG
jgi:sporulation protein YlmC with PRC-barrel domain